MQGKERMLGHLQLCCDKYEMKSVEVCRDILHLCHDSVFSKRQGKFFTTITKDEYQATLSRQASNKTEDIGVALMSRHSKLCREKHIKGSLENKNNKCCDKSTTKPEDKDGCYNVATLFLLSQQ